MIGKDWITSEDARMEYEVIDDDSGIDWDDPDLIADIFAQTDTKMDKILNKLENILFGNFIHYVALFVGVGFMTLLSWHVVRWIW